MPDEPNTLICFSCSKQASQVTPWDDWGTLWHCPKCEKWWVYIKTKGRVDYEDYISLLTPPKPIKLFPGFCYICTEVQHETRNLCHIRVYLEPTPSQTLTYFDCIRNDLDIR